MASSLQDFVPVPLGVRPSGGRQRASVTFQAPRAAQLQPFCLFKAPLELFLLQPLAGGLWMSKRRLSVVPGWKVPSPRPSLCVPPLGSQQQLCGVCCSLSLRLWEAAGWCWVTLRAAAPGGAGSAGAPTEHRGALKIPFLCFSGSQPVPGGASCELRALGFERNHNSPLDLGGPGEPALPLVTPLTAKLIDPPRAPGRAC